MLGCNVEMNIFTVLIAVIVTFIIIFSSTKYAKRKGGKLGKLPPGDLGWPIVGSTYSFFKPRSPADLGDFVKQQLSKYGKIFTARILGKTTIISADPELNKFVLQNEMRLFKNDLPSHIRNLLGGNNLQFLMGEQYKHVKSISLNFLNGWEIQTKFLEDAQKAVEWVSNSWRHKNVLHMDEEAHKYAFNIIAEKSMGMNADDPEAEQLRREFITLHEGFYALPVNLPFTCYSKALQAKKNILKIVKKRVESKKVEEQRNKKPTNWIEFIIENNLDESVENICNLVLASLFGGLVNSAICISLAIYFLGNCPEAVRKMREEHQEILREKKDDKTKLVWDDYKKMKFSQCVINETLRLGNVVPTLWRKAIHDINFKDYLIPEGTTVVTYSAAMHLDPTAYERPEFFDPWRWESMKTTNSWMPFGGGVRLCNGAEHARIEIVIFLHHFVLNYNWEPVEPDHPISLPPVVFRKGLPVEVYPLKSNI